MFRLPDTIRRRSEKLGSVSGKLQRIERVLSRVLFPDHFRNGTLGFGCGRSFVGCSPSAVPYPKRHMNTPTGRFVTKAFVIFCICAIFLDICTVVFDKYLAETFVPVLGWSFATPYLFSLIPITALRWIGSNKGRSVALNGVISFLVLGAACGIVEAWAFARFGGDENPWLRFSVFQPVCNVVIPIVWAIALFLVNRREEQVDSTE
jgi:hypothetical protein